MIKKPTMEDYTSWIDLHLNKATEDAAKAINTFKGKASAAGALRSGSTVIHVFETAFNSFDKGIDTALGELQRAIRITDLDAKVLRDETEKQLGAFLDRIKEHIRPDWLRSFAGNKPVDERLAQLDQRLPFALRQYDVGFLVPLEPEVPLTMSNHFNIGVMSGGAVQQGTSQSTQETRTEFRIDIQSARVAINAVEQSISRTDVPNDKLTEIASEIATIRAQLDKAAPSHSIVREAGQSLRNLTEGIVASSLASALWKTIGLG